MLLVRKRKKGLAERLIEKQYQLISEGNLTLGNGKVEIPAITAKLSDQVYLL